LLSIFVYIMGTYTLIRPYPSPGDRSL